MTEPDHSPPGDELTERYREASAGDTRRPGAHVREAVRAHAQMMIDARAQGTAPEVKATAPAANQSRWKISALASIALAGLTGLLVLQFDRGSDEEKDLAFGQPSASAPPAAQAPVPAAHPAAAPATTAPQAPQAQARAKTEAAENPPAAALKAPASPAAKKPVPPPAAPGQAAPKAEAETAQTLGGAAPQAAAPAPPPAPALTQGSAGFSASGRTADTAASPQAAAPPAPAVQADTSAPAPVARSAPAAAPAPAMAAAAPPAPVAAAPAAAAPAAAAEQRQEKSAARTRSLRAETTGSLGLAGALQQSARAGDLQQVERLLQQGAPLNAADAAGRTPLILAVMQGHTAVVQRLLAAGANTALIDKEGFNALQHARRLGLDGIAHLIERAS